MADKSAACALDSRVSVSSGYEYCRALVEDIGPRPAGLPAEKKAAEYIADELKKAGLKRVRLEPYRCQSMEVLKCSLHAVKPDLGEVDAWPGIYSGSTPRRGVTADLLYFDSAKDIKIHGNGKGKARLLIKSGDFAIRPGVVYRVKALRQDQVTAGKNGVLSLPLTLDGQMSVTVQATE